MSKGSSPNGHTAEDMMICLILVTVNVFFNFEGYTCMDTVFRRLELLKLEGLGFSQAEIVNELSQKLSCSKRVLYKDFESREIWQPILQSVVQPDKVLLKVLNRYEQIYRQASLRFITSSNELARMAALNIKLTLPWRRLQFCLS
jgi:hypothetical protein